MNPHNSSWTPHFIASCSASLYFIMYYFLWICLNLFENFIFYKQAYFLYLFYKLPLWLIKFLDFSYLFVLCCTISSNLESNCWLGSKHQCWGSVAFWCGSESRSVHPYLWLTDLDPDPTPDPTPFFSDFKDAKKIIFCFIFFSLTFLQAHYLQS